MKKTNKIFDTQFWVIASVAIVFFGYLAYLHIDMYGASEGLRTFSIFFLKLLGTSLAICLLVSVGIVLLALGKMRFDNWRNEMRYKHLRIKTWDDLEKFIDDTSSKD